MIPVYNLGRFLPQTIESVLAQDLDSTRLEVIVVDDGSTDDSSQVAQRYRGRVRYVPQSNRGLPAARNRGVAETTAPYLLFLDADDRLLPGKLAVEAGVLDREPSTAVASSGWYYLDASGARLPERGWSRYEGNVLDRLLLGNLIHPHAALVRRTAVQSVGGFDEMLTGAEDWDLWLRVTLAGARWRCTDRPLVEYRVRADGMHADPVRMLTNRLHVLDKVFALLGPQHELSDHRSRAYREAFLTSACEFLRAGAVREAEVAMRSAVDHDPRLLTDPRVLRRICRLLLPLGFRSDQRIVAEWPLIQPRFSWLVRTAVPAGSVGLRAHAAVARMRVALRYRRKRLVERATSAALTRTYRA